MAHKCKFIIDKSKIIVCDSGTSKLKPEYDKKYVIGCCQTCGELGKVLVLKD